MTKNTTPALSAGNPASSLPVVDDAYLRQRGPVSVFMHARSPASFGASDSRCRGEDTQADEAQAAKEAPNPLQAAALAQRSGDGAGRQRIGAVGQRRDADKESPSIRLGSIVACPGSRNCGRNAAKNSVVFGLSRATTKLSPKMRRSGTASGVRQAISGAHRAACARRDRPGIPPRQASPAPTPLPKRRTGPPARAKRHRHCRDSPAPPRPPK